MSNEPNETLDPFLGLETKTLEQMMNSVTKIYARINYFSRMGQNGMVEQLKMWLFLYNEEISRR